MSSVVTKHKPESYGASATERSSAPSRGVLNLSTGSRLLFPSFRPFDGAQDRLQPESWRFWNLNRKRTWMPAFAGMTNFTSPEGEGFQTSPRETLIDLDKFFVITETTRRKYATRDLHAHTTRCLESKSWSQYIPRTKHSRSLQANFYLPLEVGYPTTLDL
jgi:hypothetical protein